MKKIILITFFFTAIISCGKKGDPEYKAEKYISEFQKVQKYISS